MTYASVTALKAYAGISAADDDALLMELISRAQAIIENYTGRVFEAPADETRYYTVGVDTDGMDLHLDTDLAQITSITNNSNGTPVVITTGYNLLPVRPPYHIVRLYGSANSWEYTTDPERAVTIIGRFAYSITPPPDIVHATIRLATFLYRQKDASTFDVTAMPDAGVMMIPQGIPADVRIILEMYRRPVL